MFLFENKSLWDVENMVLKFSIHAYARQERVRYSFSAHQNKQSYFDGTSE